MRGRLDGLWREPDFLKLWAGDTVSMVGSQVTFIALPLTAVLTLGASPAEMGVLGALQGAPTLLLGLIAGAYADRVRRRPLLIGSVLGQAVVLALVPLAALFGTLRMELLYGVAFLAACLKQFAVAAFHAYVPTLVARDRLRDANTKLQQSFAVARTAGPGLGGVLVQILSAPIAILVDALSYVFAAAALLLIRAPETVPRGDEARRRIWHEIGEGLRFAMAQPVMRSLMGVFATATLFNGTFFALYPLLATRELGVPPAAFGAIMALIGPASLVGTLLVGPITRPFGVVPALMATLVGAGVGRLLVPLAGGPMELIVAILAAGELLRGLINPSFDVLFSTLRQSTAPLHLQGRVSATTNLLTWGLAPVGLLLGGFLAEAIGVRATMVLSVLGAVVIGLLWYWPIRSVRDLPQAAGSSAAT